MCQGKAARPSLPLSLGLQRGQDTVAQLWCVQSSKFWGEHQRRKPAWNLQLPIQPETKEGILRALEREGGDPTVTPLWPWRSPQQRDIPRMGPAPLRNSDVVALPLSPLGHPLRPLPEFQPPGRKALATEAQPNANGQTQSTRDNEQTRETPRRPAWRKHWDETGMRDQTPSSAHTLQRSRRRPPANAACSWATDIYISQEHIRLRQHRDAAAQSRTRGWQVPVGSWGCASHSGPSSLLRPPLPYLLHLGVTWTPWVPATSCSGVGHMDL